VKASAGKTPQPSPAHLLQSPPTQPFAGTTGRQPNLRDKCLKRDHHRCVISGCFDDTEALNRVAYAGDDKATDDDGQLLKMEAGNFSPLEVAHIIPHSLMNVGEASELVRVTFHRSTSNYFPCPFGLLSACSLVCRMIPNNPP
jgi:HNH endonuclease